MARLTSPWHLGPMEVNVTIGTAASAPWLPIAQIIVTAVSALTAFAAATIAARAYGAGRADRKAAEIDEVTVGIVDAWKAEKAMERAGQAFDPLKNQAERARLLASALAEMANVSHRSIWPAEIDFAVIEARRLMEDTNSASDQVTLEIAASRIRQLRQTILSGVKILEGLSGSLGRDVLGPKQQTPSSTGAMRAVRSARGNVSTQMSGRHKSFSEIKDLYLGRSSRRAFQADRPADSETKS
jgi:hypothetical protein